MAHIEFSIDDDRNLTIVAVTGEVSAAEIREAIEKHNAAKITQNILWDLSQITSAVVTPSDIQEFALLANKFTVQRQGGKTAVVVPTDFAFGMSRIYDNIQEIFQKNVQHMTFRDRDAALLWLAE